MTKKTITIFSIIIASLLVTVAFYNFAVADTNIDSTNRWAWSDNAGWWDFYSSDTVEVDGQELRGYASSSIGWMALNCNSTPNGDTCSESDFRVTNPGATGELSGCAWNDTQGWVSFWCGDGNCDGSGSEDASSTCSNSDYRVTIDANGTFSGYAWNDTEGWISFNCANNSSCGDSDFKLETSWSPGRKIGTLTSSVIDTNEDGGSTLNSVVWQGTQPSGTSVDFQIAVSDSDSGPWNFKGPDGTSDTWYGRECPVAGTSNPAAGPDTAICFDKTQTANKRYLKYKVRLRTNLAQDNTPTIENIILNWSE